jgi:uncharacterized membrane protein
MKKLGTTEIVTIGLCGALYASFGYLTTLGIFAPVIGVVRFWPAVIVPAVFATLFGPWVGGLGAAIGIFISDLVIHGNALLSLAVGVPSNFIGFYLLGYIARKRIGARMEMGGLLLSGIFALFTGILLVYAPQYLTGSVSLFFLGVGILSVVLTMSVYLVFPRWRSYQIASVIGLGVGSVWIGVGVWLFSQFFVVTTTMETNLPLYGALGWFIWTYYTEIPFLILVVPPILSACYRAFPTLRPHIEG